jgi:SEFIR domain
MPKVFISYSWTSPGHQATVKQWAERLLADGVEVVLDIFDLKEGHDKYAFMEQMVTDSTVTHVLVMCDKAYAEKADARKAGVGTETQIISKEVYDKVSQSKFIPIACELDEKGNWYLPTFLKSRIGILHIRGCERKLGAISPLAVRKATSCKTSRRQAPSLFK